MLRTLHLNNFKSFAASSVTFGPASLILGSNATGKSNLFDAIRLLKSVGDGQSVRDAIEGHVSYSPGSTEVSGIRGGSAGITHFRSDNKVFTLAVELLTVSGVVEYEVAVDAESYRVVKEELKAEDHPGPYVFSTHPETGHLEQRSDSPVIVARFYKGTRGLNPRREFSPHQFILSQFRGRRAESRLNEDIAAFARAELASFRHLELRPEVLRQYSATGRFEMGEHGENFAAVVSQLRQEAEAERRLLQRLERTHSHWDRVDEKGTRQGQRIRADINFLEGQLDEKTQGDGSALKRLAAIRSWLSELTPAPVEDIAVQTAPTGEVIFALTEGGAWKQTVSARSLSDGTLRFAALAFAAVGARGRQTLIVEELENGMNPARLSLLVRLIEQSAHADEAVQVIASTHSPTVLDFASQELVSSSTVIGWDSESGCSRPVGLRSITSLESILEDTTLGTLQAEGWLQFAVNS